MINSKKQFREEFLKFFSSEADFPMTFSISAGVQTDLGSEKIEIQSKSLQGTSTLFQYFLDDFFSTATPSQIWNVFGGESFTPESVGLS